MYLEYVSSFQIKWQYTVRYAVVRLWLVWQCGMPRPGRSHLLPNRMWFNAEMNQAFLQGESTNEAVSQQASQPGRHSTNRQLNNIHPSVWLACNSSIPNHPLTFSSTSFETYSELNSCSVGYVEKSVILMMQCLSDRCMLVCIICKMFGERFRYW